MRCQQRGDHGAFLQQRRFGAFGAAHFQDDVGAFQCGFGIGGDGRASGDIIGIGDAGGLTGAGLDHNVEAQGFELFNGFRRRCDARFSVGRFPGNGEFQSRAFL